MYCIKCGVKLADTEQKCPLCDTVVFHPDFEATSQPPLYPNNKMPRSRTNHKALNGAVIFLFLIPILVCFFADRSLDGKIEWWGYVAGALALFYVAFALPMWFKKPNPVIFVPCNFLAVALYLLYINLATDGNWFLSFALPVVGGVCLIISAVVTLIYYLRKGILYILGGAFMVSGVFVLLVEFLIKLTFGLPFMGWSIYPLVVLFLFGGFMILVAADGTVREMIERKLFF